MRSKKTTRKARIARALAVTITLAAAVTVAHLTRHLGVDWYPRMGVHAVHVIAGSRFCSAGWVQSRPGHVVFSVFCNRI